jgi:WD40 repeat protein
LLISTQITQTPVKTSFVQPALVSDQDLSNYPGYYHTGSVFSLKSIDDNLFASSSKDKTVKVWNLTVIFNDMSLGAPLTLRQFAKVNVLDYDRAAKFLISVADDGLINIYSMEQRSDQYGKLLGSYTSGQRFV